MATPAERLAAVKQSIETLKEKIAALKTAKQEQINWASYGKKSEVAYAFAIRRQLRGHFGKVYAVDWGSDNTSLLSASQDGACSAGRASIQPRPNPPCTVVSDRQTHPVERDERDEEGCHHPEEPVGDVLRF